MYGLSCRSLCCVVIATQLVCTFAFVLPFERLQTSRSSSSSSSSSKGCRLPLCTPLSCSTSSSPELSTQRVVPSTKDKSSILSQAALIAGTTIGGGFLALPSATAPAGFFAASTGLIASWAYLLACALSLTETIFMIKGIKDKEWSVNSKQAELEERDSDSTVSSEDSNEDSPVQEQEMRRLSMFSIVKKCLGSAAGTAAGGVFLVLMMATLVAQLSKVGVLLEGNLSNVFLGLSGIIGDIGTRNIRNIGIIRNIGSPRAIGVLLFSAVSSAVCSANRRAPRAVERVNNVLTATMLASFLALVLVTVSGTGWSLAGLSRSNFALLLPPILRAAVSSQPSASAVLTSASAINSASAGQWAVPVFIQLLLYAEVVPLVCARLQCEKRARKAILLGSCVPLGMCITWTAIALGLAPFDEELFRQASMAGVAYDPVSALLLHGGGAVSVCVRCLAFSAISTTVIGALLSTGQFLEDIFVGEGKSESVGIGIDEGEGFKVEDKGLEKTMDAPEISPGQGGGIAIRPVRLVRPIVRPVFLMAASIAPPALVAAYGSRQLYYAATAFAGAFPCTFLYGLLPPLCNLSLRYRLRGQRMGKDNSPAAREGGAVVLQFLLALLSAAMMLANL